jgi:DNA-binding CsgD family transcriptional regulator
MTDAPILAVLEAGQCAAGLADYERRVLAGLRAIIPCEQAFFVRQNRIGAHTEGFDDRVRRDTLDRFELYGRELAPFTLGARSSGGVGVDRAFFGGRQLERLSHFREVMQPHRGRSSLIGYLEFREQLLGCVVLGRSTSSFSSAEQASLRAALPALSLCDVAVYRRQPHNLEVESALSPRERDVLGYLGLGYTNREIAVACGTSPRTVRNQLSAVFRKLGASTRSEAVAISLGRL